MLLMNDAAKTKRLYKVVAKNGGESRPVHLGQANRIAKALRSGQCGTYKVAPVACQVVAA